MSHLPDSGYGILKIRALKNLECLAAFFSLFAFLDKLLEPESAVQREQNIRYFELKNIPPPPPLSPPPRTLIMPTPSPNILSWVCTPVGLVHITQRVHFVVRTGQYGQTHGVVQPQQQAFMLLAVAVVILRGFQLYRNQCAKQRGEGGRDNNPDRRPQT
jgi:hypothetical protein